jgi:hypothetical protein
MVFQVKEIGKMEIIADFLQSEIGTRLTYGWRWLVWDDMDKWQVYERLPYAKKTKTIYAGENLGEALDNLKSLWNEIRSNYNGRT